jgi:hypothetical protein
MRTVSRIVVPLAMLVFAVAPSVTQAGPAVDSQITDTLSSCGVTGSTYQKVYGGRALDYDDITNLVTAKVPSHIIVSYLQSTEKVYKLTPTQLSGLKSAGASPEVLNYLGETEGFYGYNPPAQADRKQQHQNDAYYNTQASQDEQPFGYNEPIIDDWYDSGYEESLYSPFSMN